MGGIDRCNRRMVLEALGWTEDPDTPDNMIPPQSLWDNRPKSLHLYAALDLQDLLGEPTFAENEDGDWTLRYDLIDKAISMEK